MQGDPHGRPLDTCISLYSSRDSTDVKQAKDARFPAVLPRVCKLALQSSLPPPHHLAQA
jgi:hypothetical protein